MNRFKTITKVVDLFKILENEVLLVLDPIELRSKQIMKFKTYRALPEAGDADVTVEPRFRVGNTIKTRITVTGHNADGILGYSTVEDLPASCDATIILGVNTQTIYVLDEDKIREFADLYAAERMHDLHEMYTVLGDYYIVSKYGQVELG